MTIMLVLRWIHILSAITLMGGAIFMRFALMPAARELPEDVHNELRGRLKARWSKIVMLTSGLLLLSGLVNFYLTTQAYTLAKPYHMLFGIKFLLSLPIFYIASLLAGRSATAQRVQANAKRWLTVNVCLATAVVGIGGFLRYTDRTPKMVTPAVSQQNDGSSGAANDLPGRSKNVE